MSTGAAVKRLTKRAIASAGLTVVRRDRLAEQIPPDYLRSDYLPPIYRQSLARLIYFEHIFSRVARVEGDLVECGVSIGTGLLNWALLTELSRIDRHIIGFDSFSGFPASKEQDRKADGSYQTSAGDYASAPELVLRVLADGRVSPDFIRNRVRLVRGYFDDTLASYGGAIALLHLDCDLHDSYTVCLRQLYGRVVTGGVIMFDEYEDATFPGAKVAIDEFFHDKPEKPVRYERYQYVKYHVVKM